MADKLIIFSKEVADILHGTILKDGSECRPILLKDGRYGLDERCVDISKTILKAEGLDKTKQTIANDFQSLMTLGT